ncbi:MAG TPA: hypothetical protein PKA90_07505 [Ignavibacteria bacterium]|nr:hypothetical protein [Ignavibacteria bacterium]HMR40262.1 hypothetical protein [Ignavibacteria bacterium]
MKHGNKKKFKKQKLEYEESLKFQLGKFSNSVINLNISDTDPEFEYEDDFKNNKEDFKKNIKKSIVTGDKVDRLPLDEEGTALNPKTQKFTLPETEDVIIKEKGKNIKDVPL